MTRPLPNIPQPLTRPVVVRVPAAVDSIVVELFERRSAAFSHLSLEEFYGQIIATHESVRVHLLPPAPLSLVASESSPAASHLAEENL